GDAPWDLNTWDLFETHAGKKVAILHWGECWSCGDFNYQKNQYNTVRSRGAIPFVDWGPTGIKLSNIASGANDAYITSWAQQAAAWKNSSNQKNPLFLRFAWEMNGSWFDWGTAQGNPQGNTPQDYINAWRHIHDIFTQQGATNVTWVWCPNTEFTGSVPLAQLYPGDTYVDWTCIDGYNWSQLQNNPWMTFSQVFQQTYTDILKIAPSKPIIIGETASSELGGSKATWITDMLSTQLPNYFQNIKAFLWFNWNTDNADWVIETSSSSQNAFKNGISSSYYATNNFANFNTNPIPPLDQSITVTPTLTLTPTQAILKGDVNGDNKVDSKDVVQVLNNYGTTSGYPLDQFADGKINSFDLVVVVDNIISP
ncbi:hypothetical protein M1615_00770, partial [Patescibacteria group bacterium]|nr:hypothetical protein [Patescibacteria group bacterium]